MTLDYLNFDFSDDDAGGGSFDAMAAVVLAWACAAFGPATAVDDGGEWDFELQGSDESGIALPVTWDMRDGQARLEPSASGADDQSFITLTLTLGGSPAFCEAFAERFKLLT
jgi:hypothetical protein